MMVVEQIGAEQLLDLACEDLMRSATFLPAPNASVQLIEGELSAQDTLAYAVVMSELGMPEIAVALVQAAMMAKGAEAAQGSQAR